MFKHLAVLAATQNKSAKDMLAIFFGMGSRYGRFASTRRNRSNISMLPNGKRERARRIRQGAHQNQINSHLPGAVWPAHLGARITAEG